jgi:uncharacterized protein YndB with AHSA1/START domain
VDVDREAPVIVEAEIEIAAPPEAVWEVLTDLARWPSWNPDVKSMSFEGAVAEGSDFRWKAGPGTITSTLRRVERPLLRKSLATGLERLKARVEAGSGA